MNRIVAANFDDTFQINNAGSDLLIPLTPWVLGTGNLDVMVSCILEFQNGEATPETMFIEYGPAKAGVFLPQHNTSQGWEVPAGGFQVFAFARRWVVPEAELGDQADLELYFFASFAPALGTFGIKALEVVWTRNTGSTTIFP